MVMVLMMTGDTAAGEEVDASMVLVSPRKKGDDVWKPLEKGFR